MPRFHQTEIFRYISQRPNRAGIRDAWIGQVIENPEHEEPQTDERIRRWARISDFDRRVLSVILPEDARIVRNATVDLDYEEEQK